MQIAEGGHLSKRLAAENAVLRRRTASLGDKLTRLLSEEDIDAQILRLRAKGHSIREIARRVGLSKTAVWKQLKQLETPWQRPIHLHEKLHA